MQVFLVDVISLTRANCAQPMSYFSSLLVLLLGLKILLLLVRYPGHSVDGLMD